MAFDKFEYALFRNALYKIANDKVDKVEGKGLSTNDYTTAEKEKLANTDANTTINTEGDILLAHNTIYRRGELANLTFPLISNPADNFNSGVQFTSGETPTAITDSTNAYWQGMDVVLVDNINVFQPAANKRYGIYFEYDGTIIKAFSEAVAL